MRVVRNFVLPRNGVQYFWSMRDGIFAKGQLPCSGKGGKGIETVSGVEDLEMPQVVVSDEPARTSFSSGLQVLCA